MLSQSPEINEIAKALCAAQMEFGKAVKNSSNPFFKSKYADLESVIDASREMLGKNGLSFTQIMGCDETCHFLITTLMHNSGQYISSQMKLELSKKDMQALGSAITYARRYSLQSMIGLSAEDDDGEGSMNRNEIKVKTPQAKQTTLIDEIKVLAKKLFSDPDTFKAWRIDNGLSENLSTASDFDKAKLLVKLKEFSNV